MTVDEAIKALIIEYHIGDFIYQVREHASGEGGFKGNSWDHPKVKRYAQIVAVLENHCKS